VARRVVLRSSAVGKVSLTLLLMQPSRRISAKVIGGNFKYASYFDAIGFPNTLVD